MTCGGSAEICRPAMVFRDMVFRDTVFRDTVSDCATIFN